MHIFTKMKKELFQTIEIPEGVTVSIEGNDVKVKGNEGEISKKFSFGRLDIKKEGNTITIGNKKATKTEKKLMNTLVAHLNNMLKGVQEKFEYELKICSGHFPMTVKQEGSKVIIKNFLGEKINREVKINEGVDIEIKGEMITLKSMDKEKAGQTAANFEHATVIKGRDKRIFQDGVYITKKAGKEI